MLSDKAIQEFQDTYLSEYGVEVTREEATALLNQLLALYDQIYNPIKKDWLVGL